MPLFRRSLALCLQIFSSEGLKMGEVDIPIKGSLNYRAPVNNWFALHNGMGGINCTLYTAAAPI